LLFIIQPQISFTTLCSVHYQWAELVEEWRIPEQGCICTFQSELSETNVSESATPRPELAFDSKEVFQQIGWNTCILRDLQDKAVELILPCPHCFARSLHSTSGYTSIGQQTAIGTHIPIHDTCTN
jgi:hypothetical protein